MMKMALTSVCFLKGFFAAVMEYFEDVRVYFTERFSLDGFLGNSSYMMIMFCTILFIWLMMMFSSEKSNPNAATNASRQPKR